MLNKISKSKIQIIEPILEMDFEASVELVQKNICHEENLDLEYLHHLSNGEFLVAKIGEEVVGMLSQRRPGRIFNELDDEFFALDQIQAEKVEIGWIVLVSVNSALQNKGIGKSLLIEALKRQEEWGSKCVGTHSWQGSPDGSSQKLFESFGFKATKRHKSPWFNHSKRVGPKGYWCVVCGNPCKCDELEMIKYL